MDLILFHQGAHHVKHYRIRNPRTRLLLAGFTPAGDEVAVANVGELWGVQ